MRKAAAFDSLRSKPGQAWCYVLAVASVALAWAVREAVDPLLHNQQPFGLFFVAVLVMAWWTDWRAALLTMVLGYVTADWFFLPPRHSLGPHDLQSAGAAGVFLFVSSSIIYFTHRMRTTKQRLQERTQELARANSILRQRTGELRQVVEALPQLVWLAGPQGRHEYFNRRWLEYTGATSEQLQDQGWFGFLHPEDRPAAQAQWERCSRSGQPYELTYRLRRGRDGTYRWFLGRAVAVLDTEGKLTRWVGTSTEIQELREAQEELLQARDELARSNQGLERTVQERTTNLQKMVEELRQLSYSIVHDLRAPLRAIQSYSSMVEAECGAHAPASVREYLLRMRTASSRMDELITDVLAYSGITQRPMPLRVLAPGELLSDMVDTYPMFQRPQAEIEIESLPPVLGNTAALAQCFSNLLENAVKFAKPGRVPQVRVRAEISDQWVRLIVEDQGIGIRKDLQARVFDLFQQVNRSYEGTGVGLAIVRKAAERMGGRVGVQSEEGKGSQFWVELRAPEKDVHMHSLAV